MNLQPHLDQPQVNPTRQRNAFLLQKRHRDYFQEQSAKFWILLAGSCSQASSWLSDCQKFFREQFIEFSLEEVDDTIVFVSYAALSKEL